MKTLQYKTFIKIENVRYLGTAILKELKVLIRPKSDEDDPSEVWRHYFLQWANVIYGI